jgi:isoleucyl-tRNA synthetase
MVASPILRGNDLQIDREGHAIREVVRLVLKPIWNAYYFFCLYANAENIEARFSAESEQLLDRYILAKTRDLTERVGEDLDAYDIPGACAKITGFIDALNNWYIRRSRPRFWSQEKSPDKLEAYNTLYTVMHVLLRTASPLLPILSEEIYTGLTGEQSVHLCDWPDPEVLPGDPQLVNAMDRVRDICSAALALRRAHNVRVRQPLRALTVAGANAAALEPLADLIRDEVNVKEVILSGELDRYARFRLQVNARALGKRLGVKMQEVIVAAKSGEWSRLDDTRVEVAGEVLGEGEFSILLDAKGDAACQALGSNDAVVMLDLELDPELEREGQARDIVRVVQQARREADLHVADRIHLVLEVPEGWEEAASRFGDYIAEQTLALRLDLSATAADASFARHEASVSGQPIRVRLKVMETA